MLIQDKKAMGARIRKAREFMGLTREKFAERLDLSLGFVAEIERGDGTMSIDTLLTISNAIKLSPNEILIGDSVTSEEYDEMEAIRIMLMNCEPKKREYAVKLLKLFLVSCDWK